MRNTIGILCSLALWQAGSAFAQDEEMSYGKAEYLNSCAACHGERGIGNGPLAPALVTRPADLTELSEKNGGEFPYYRVFAVIDGRYVVPGHGDRDMPVWGQQFIEEDTRTFGPLGGEIVTTDRIHALAEYIATLQQ